MGHGRTGRVGVHHGDDFRVLSRLKMMGDMTVVWAQNGVCTVRIYIYIICIYYIYIYYICIYIYILVVYIIYFTNNCNMRWTIFSNYW